MKLIMQLTKGAVLLLCVHIISAEITSNHLPLGGGGASGGDEQAVAEIERQFNQLNFHPMTAHPYNRRKRRPFTVNVEGLVGSGKSTLLQFFKGHPGIDVMPEPIDKWTNLNGTNLLSLAARDPKRWAMSEESYIQLTMLRQHLHRGGLGKVMERSIHSPRTVYVENLMRSGQIQKVEYDILDDWYQFLNGRDCHRFDLRTDLTIYLRSKPSVVLERIRKHPMGGAEAHMNVAFLENLSRLHEDWLVHKNTSFPLPSDKILVIDSSRPLETMRKVYKALAKRIFSMVPMSPGATSARNGGQPQTTSQPQPIFPRQQCDCHGRGAHMQALGSHPPPRADFVQGDMVFKSSAHEARPWDHGLVPFKVEGNFTKEEREKIYDAVAKFMIETRSCVRWVERTTETTYVTITNSNPGGPGCYSCVGKDGCSIGGVHKNWLNLGPMCFEGADGAVIKHEMMHTLGMQHEEDRPDRDHFIRVNYGNTKQRPAFRRRRSAVVYRDYDYGSLMHNPRCIYSDNACETLTPAEASKRHAMDTRTGMTESDVHELKCFYQCPTKTPCVAKHLREEPSAAATPSLARPLTPRVMSRTAPSTSTTPSSSSSTSTTSSSSSSSTSTPSPTSSSSSCSVPCGRSNLTDFRNIPVEGTNAYKGEVGWQVGLSRYNTRSGPVHIECGGALLNDRWVLTAAQCDATAYAWVGLIKRDAPTEGMVYKVKRRVAHPNYAPWHNPQQQSAPSQGQQRPANYDFALLELESPVDFRRLRHVSPACWPTSEPSAKSQAAVSGWGDTAKAGRVTVPMHLQKTKAEFISRDECKREIRTPAGQSLTPAMMCAVNGGPHCKAGPSKDVYVSKVGDPAVTVKSGGSRWEVSGVASWGAGDHCTKVYANVYYVRHWIESVAGRECGRR